VSKERCFFSDVAIVADIYQPELTWSY